MDFSSLVLMEKDNETGFIKKELGSFEVSEGAIYVKKLYMLDDIVYMYFDTNKDVEEWEYSAIYDLFNDDIFEEKGYEIEEDLDEYNPTYIIKFKYVRRRILIAMYNSQLRMKSLLDFYILYCMDFTKVKFTANF